MIDEKQRCTAMLVITVDKQKLPFVFFKKTTPLKGFKCHLISMFEYKKIMHG